MENTKLSQENAFPEMEQNGNNTWNSYPGISKLFYAACAAMQGLCSNSFFIESINKLNYDADKERELLIKTAYQMANELLKQESK